MGKYDELVGRLEHCSNNTRDEYLHELTGRAATAITTLEAELAAMKARGDRLAEALDTSGYAVNAAAMEVDAEWRGYDLKAGKYRKIVTEFRDQRRQALTEWRQSNAD